MAKLMDGVSEKIPMRSAILGAFAIFFEVLGYYALTAYMYEHSKVCGIIMFLCTTRSGLSSLPSFLLLSSCGRLALSGPCTSQP